MGGIQAITFDVGGTLIEPWPSVGHVYASVAEENGIPGLLPEQLNHRFAAAWRTQGGCAESREDWAAIVGETFREIIAVPDPILLFESLYERFTEPAVWHVFEDVLPSLSALRSRGHRLAVLSNWDDRLRPLLKRLELMDYFEAAVISCEIGCRKPDPEVFLKAAQTLGLAPKQVLHVGDSLEHDVSGASGAGMQAVGINRVGDPADPSWIRTLNDLPVFR